MPKPSTSTALALLNTALPLLVAFYKDLRTAHPGQAALTDAQMIDLLGQDSATLVETAQAWLAAHPSGE